MRAGITMLLSPCALLIITSAVAATAFASPEPVEGLDLRIAGPFIHENLAVYLLEGKESLAGKSYLTLQEALDRKIVVVHETGQVNELSVENVSSDQDVYVQSGDIVKGGRQDRTIAQDFICPPHSGKMPISAFCVESGRWHGRGDENPTAFASSENAVAGKSLKLACKYRNDQSQVWQQVAENQKKLGEVAGANVNDSRSASSFELTLENKKVDEATRGYVQALQKIIDDKPEVIGFAFAINGRMNSGEVYGSHQLFTKLWPKLLRSSAVEAMAERRQGKIADAPSVDAVKAFITDASSGKSESRDVTKRVELVRQESKQNVVFETRDRDAARGSWVHRSYMTKDETDAGAPPPTRRQAVPPGIDQRINQQKTNENSPPQETQQQTNQRSQQR